MSVEQVSHNLDPECVSLREASRGLGVCVRTVRREIERGRLAAFRVGRSLRIRGLPLFAKDMRHDADTGGRVPADGHGIHAPQRYAANRENVHGCEYATRLRRCGEASTDSAG